MIVLNPRDQKKLLTILHNAHVINGTEGAETLRNKILKQLEERKEDY